jgi:integrase
MRSLAQSEMLSQWAFDDAPRPDLSPAILRAQELNSLRPSSFDFDSDPATVTVHCTISKRRKTDTHLLSRDFAQMLKSWLAEQDGDRQLWGR